jgi:hypothetical protein
MLNRKAILSIGAAAFVACGGRSGLLEADLRGPSGHAGGTSTSAVAGGGAGGTGPSCSPDGAPCGDAAACCSTRCASGACAPAPCHAGDDVVVLASGLKTPQYLALDGGRIVATDADSFGGGVVAVDIGGGPLKTLVTTGARPRGILADPVSITWTDAIDYSVFRIPSAGGAVETLATQQEYAGPMARAGESLFWTNGGPPLAGSVMRLDPGGVPVVLAAGQHDPWGIAADGSGIAWANQSSAGGGQGQVFSMAFDGSPVMVASDQATPTDVALDGDRVYWSGNGGVHSAPRDGSSPPKTLAGGFAARGMALAGGAVYFADFGHGLVLKMARDGGPITMIAKGQTFPVGVVVDDWCVYWGSGSGSGVIVKAPR